MGTEISVNYRSNRQNVLDRLVSQIYVGYTYIDTYRNTADSTSRYSNIREKLVVSLQQNLTPTVTLGWNFMYKERTGSTVSYDFTNQEYILEPYSNIYQIDVRCSYHKNKFNLYAECSNLLDLEYYESGSIPQPGRWIRGGVSYRFGW